MSQRTATHLAWALWGLCVAMVMAAGVLFAFTHGTPVEGKNPGVDLVLSVVLLSFSTVGTLVAFRWPRNAIGWLLLAIGLAFSIRAIAEQYAIATLFAGTFDLPGGMFAAWLSESLALPALFGCAIVLLLFPTGHLPSRRWRPVAWIAVLSTVLISLEVALDPGPLQEFKSLDNPAGISSLQTLLSVIAVIGWFGSYLSVLAAAASVLVRFRRARGDERVQLKWVAAGVTMLAVLWLSAFLLPSDDPVYGAIFAVAVLAFPVSIGIAMFKYRLYEIDRIVSRTLVYGTLTVGLAGLYFGIVLALQAAFSGFTRGNDLAIAGSTLAVAALFRPARRRIQALVDRRFYRRRYDAQRTLETFSARLRDELDLDTLGAELSAVVSETMQPAHVSLWLRPTGRDR